MGMMLSLKRHLRRRKNKLHKKKGKKYRQMQETPKLQPQSSPQPEPPLTGIRSYGRSGESFHSP